MSKMLRVDMTTLKVSTDDSPPEYERLGGRSLIARILNQEVPPTCHPLGKHNKMIFAPGLFAGSRFPSSGRLSIGFKSPMTQGIKESNVGGTAGEKLGRLGIKAIILEGQPADTKLYLIKINKEGASILPANALAGLNNRDTVTKLKEAHGKDTTVISISNPGEMRMLLATIAGTDTEGRPTRHAARGGPGAVMGSKRIKAIVIDDSGTKPVKAKDGEAFRNLVKEYANFVTESKGAQAYKVQGTMGGLTFLSERTTSLPTRNFTAGSFEGARAIGHRKKVEEMKTQGSKWGVACMPGCLVCCSNIICDENGNYITSGLEYESVAMLGANLGIDDIYAIANMDALADNYGVDTIELGVTLGIAVDAGLLEFGDSARAIELIHEIGKGTTLGRILGQGTAITAKVFGISRVPVVKGQGVPAHEPRAENVTGVTYCTSAMGADHTAGLNLERKASSTEAIEASRQAQINVAIVDSLGLCVNSFIDPGFPMERITELVNAVCGLNLSYADLQDMGKAMLKEERAFNLKAGFAPGADRLPEFFKEEPLPPNNFVFDVPDSEIDSFWDF